MTVAHRTTNLASINTTKLKNLPVLIPPKEEQVDTIEMLQSADEKIAAEEDRKVALQSFFQSMLHQLMTGQVRLFSDDIGLTVDATATSPSSEHFTYRIERPNQSLEGAAAIADIARLTGLTSLTATLKSSMPDTKSMNAIMQEFAKQAQMAETISKSFSQQGTFTAALFAADSVSSHFNQLLGIDAANTIATQLAQFSRQHAESIEQIFRQARNWESSFSSIQKVVGIEHIEKRTALQYYLQDVARISASAEMVLGKISWEQINQSWKVDELARQSTQNTLTDFSLKYADFYRSIDLESLTSSVLSPSLTRLPSTELFNSAHSFELLTYPSDSTRWESELDEMADEINEPVGDRVEQLLYRVNPQFVDMLRGARHSLNSANPDRIRHFSVSIRELLTHLLHTLAPDDAIRMWSNESAYYDKGRPTRRGRVLYICREINHPPFSDCLNADIKALLQYMDLMQNGTHKIALSFTSKQLRILQNRAESGLLFLLETALLIDHD